MALKRSGRAFALAAGAAGLGITAGGLSAAFLYLIDWGQRALWESGGLQYKYGPLLICTFGGILVGLCQRYLGDYPKNLQSAVNEIRKTGRMEYAHLPNGLISAAISLIFGASLGPEAAIVNLFGGLSTWASDMLKKLGRRLRNFDSTVEESLLQRRKWRWPYVMLIGVAFVIFIAGIKDLYSGGILRLLEPFSWVDLLWSIPMALVGAAGGFLFLALGKWMKQRDKFHTQKPILRGALSGLILGLIASFLPTILFSGQTYMQQIYDQAAELGFWMLLLIALVKLFLITLLSENGWKGGQFFPLMFSSVALGLSVKCLFQIIPDSAAIFSTMAAIVTVVLPKPLVVLILMTIFFPAQYAGISAVGVGVTMLVYWIWKRVKERSIIEKNISASHSPAD